MADPLSVIGTVIGLIAAAEAAYDKIKAIKGLPKAFSEVRLRLPIAQEILKRIDEKYGSLTVSNANKIANMVESCRKDAEALKTILEMLPPRKDATSSWDSILKQYISIIKIRGKKDRVETLTEKMLQGIQLLANHETIKEATDQTQLKKLEDAIRAIQKVEASIPDESLEDNRSVSIAHGGHGPQNFQVGDNNKQFSHFGSGNVIETANFEPTSVGKRKVDALSRLNAPSCDDHKNRNPDATANTCKWFTEHPKFINWLERNCSPMFWVSADPGCGKSVLAKHLVDDVLPKLCRSSRIIYFFFKDDNADQDNAVKAVKGLLDQLLKNESSLFTESILGSLEELGDSKLNSFTELWRIFQRILGYQKANSVICVLDALDECKDGRSDLVKALRNFSTNHSVCTRILLLSRPYRAIHFEITRDNKSIIHLSGEDQLEVDKISAEIDLVIRETVNSLGIEGDKDMICKEISQRENRTYLWVHLICKMLSDANPVTNDGLRALIRQLPSTVEQLYEKILAKIMDKHKAKVLFHIVVAAIRPLSLEEMATAIAVESCSSSDSEPPVLGTGAFQKSIRNICGLFLVVNDNRVYLIHQTAREFLLQVNSNCSQTTLHSEWKHSLALEESNKVMSSICIRYLLYLGKHDKAVASLEGGEDPPMFEYAAIYWAFHYRSSSMLEVPNWGMSNDLSQLLNSKIAATWFKFFVQKDKPNVLVHIDREESVYSDSKLPESSVVRAIDLALYFGIGDVAKNLLEKDHGLYMRAGDGLRSALCWAAASGYYSMVKLVLDTRSKLKVNQSQESVDVGSPVLFAARGGHDDIVKTLLDQKDAKVNLKQWISAVLGAMSHGHNSTFGILLHSQIRIYSEFPHTVWGKIGNLFQPTHPKERVTLGTARMLLESGSFDPESRDRAGRTALSLASCLGHLDMINMLLEYLPGQIDVNSRSNSGKTPLSYAALLDRSAIVDRLLQCSEVDPNAPDYQGDTPLSLAVDKINMKIVDRLLRCPKVDPNPRDAIGWTPLACAVSSLSAACCGNDKAVSRLLQCPEVDRESRDNRGRTPLSLAAELGSVQIVDMLLQCPEVDPDSRDLAGFTPLARAARDGNIGSAISLLQTNKVNVNSRDESGKTPLFWAARNNVLPLVKRFCRTGQIDEISISEALEIAVRRRNPKVLNWLIENGVVDVTLEDYSKRRALMSRAMKHDSMWIVKPLHERWKDCLGVRNAIIFPQSPIIEAIEHDALRVLEYLIDAAQLDVHLEFSWESGDGKTHNSTLLRRAEDKGSQRIVEYLLRKTVLTGQPKCGQSMTQSEPADECCRHCSCSEALEENRGK